MTDEERTLEPTPQRRQRARAEGQFAHGRTLGGAVVLCGGLAMMHSFGPSAATGMMLLLREQLAAEAWRCVTPEKVQTVSLTLMTSAARLTGPFMVGGLIMAVGVHLLQTGGLWLPHRVLPDLQRIHPGQGWRRLCGVERLVDGGWYLAVLMAGLGGAATALWCHRHVLLEPSAHSSSTMIMAICGQLPRYGLMVAAGLLVVAVAEYGYRRWRFEVSLRMSPAEVREELRGREGDLRVRTLRRAAHGGLARRQSPVARDEADQAAASSSS